MQGAAELALIAELGVGFAGFVAIFLIFARRDGRFSPADSLRVRSIITASFQTVFASLLPLALSLYGLSGPQLWRIASLLAIAAAVPVVLHIARLHLSLAPQDRAEVGLAHSYIAWGLSAVSVVLFIANAAGSLGGPGAALYVSALIGLLGIATSNFVTIAFSSCASRARRATSR